ncbi:MAG: Membrane associated serine protease GlpG [Candidatus Methanohalarchaeum thermophilum]|uniref:Membrane associated serine protease GlpG n=1 Tax=Methanohalarchaeum thermophilum TaxID=1903181 RepID=A0A1Q6DUM1_METT1|nr:MAG: Membrane associated serine protease GlpG [Candidatus Methanohalarchaeum thermophilum]
MTPIHLFNNIFATLIISPFAEAVFNTKKPTSWIAGRFSKPKYRALFLFPLLWFIVGLSTSIGSPPGLGFSGVFFALVGFCIILYPFTVIGLTLTRYVLGIIITSIIDPIEITKATLVLSEPSWSNIGVWAHLFGFLIGITIGITIFVKRNDLKKPKPLYVLISIITVGLIEGLYRVFALNLEDRFVSYSGAGISLILIIAFISALFWRYYKKEETFRTKKITKLGSRTQRDYNIEKWKIIYIVFLVFIVVSGTSIGLMKTLEGKPSSNLNNQSIKYQGYNIWFNETRGLMIYNHERNIYANLITPQKLEINKNYSFNIGTLLDKDKIQIRYSSIQNIKNTELSSIWIKLNQSKPYQILFNKDPIPLNQKITKNKLYIALEPKNISYKLFSQRKYTNQTLCYINQTKASNMTINNQNLKAYIQDNYIKIENQETELTLAKIESRLPS